jgi:hypothetical protein
MARWTEGDAPFFLLSTFGGSTDLRGYASGRFRDRMMYAAQTEYRWQFSDRWIFTGFVGFGEVADRFSNFGNNYLPAAGVGTRFVLSKEHRVGLSFDVATGTEGTEVANTCIAHLLPCSLRLRAQGSRASGRYRAVKWRDLHCGRRAQLG